MNEEPLPWRISTVPADVSACSPSQSSCGVTSGASTLVKCEMRLCVCVCVCVCETVCVCECVSTSRLCVILCMSVCCVGWCVCWGGGGWGGWGVVGFGECALWCVEV